MQLKECCKTCKYSRALGGSSNGWCVLRKIKVHSEIAGYAFCHHWSHTEPALPVLDSEELITEEQLDFARELVLSESFSLQKK